MKYKLYSKQREIFSWRYVETYNNFQDCKAASEDLQLKGFITKIEQVVSL